MGAFVAGEDGGTADCRAQASVSHARDPWRRRASATSASSSGWTVRRSTTVVPSITRAMTGLGRDRSASVWSPDTATPTDSISTPGSVPPPGVAAVATSARPS